MSDVETERGAVEFTPPPAVASADRLEPTGAAGPPDEDLGDEQRRKRRHLLTPRSLNARLTTGVVLLVVLLVGAIGTSTYLALKVFLTNRLDQQLSSTAGSSLNRLFGSNGQYEDRGVRSPTDVWFVAVNPAGSIAAYPTYSGGDTGIEKLELRTADAKRLASATPGTPTTVRTVHGQELRVTTLPPGPVPTNAGYVNLILVVGLSTYDERRTLGRLFVIELTIGAGAVLVALVATTYGVRFGLRRLRRVTTTAQEVAAELSPTGSGLERRVPDDEPETEVGQLATSFNTMLAAVETQFAARIASEERMRQFMADASHELRTPLTSIRGYAELARMQRAVGEAAEDNIARIESEGTRMSRLVEDLLMLARGDGNGPGSGADRPQRLELIDIAGLVDDAVRGSRAAIPDREIVMHVSDDPHVVGDPDQLLRVVRNLVTNAAIHTAPERPIQVLAASSPAGVVIQVIDGGPGLAPEEAAHVFERFWRADKARTRARGGSGLGLSIVASIVAAHNGTVRFDSTVEGGSTVTVTLPDAQRELD